MSNIKDEENKVENIQDLYKNRIRNRSEFSFMACACSHPDNRKVSPMPITSDTVSEQTTGSESVADVSQPLPPTPNRCAREADKRS